MLNLISSGEVSLSEKIYKSSQELKLD